MSGRPWVRYIPFLGSKYRFSWFSNLWLNRQLSIWCTCKNRVVQKEKSDWSENFHLEKRKHHIGMTGPDIHGMDSLTCEFFSLPICLPLACLWCFWMFLFYSPSPPSLRRALGLLPLSLCCLETYFLLVKELRDYIQDLRNPRCGAYLAVKFIKCIEASTKFHRPAAKDRDPDELKSWRSVLATRVFVLTSLRFSALLIYQALWFSKWFLGQQQHHLRSG